MDVWKLLPLDIHMDILSRLYTKDLHQVECVCKCWQSIIKSSRFYMLQIYTTSKSRCHYNAFVLEKRKCYIQPLNFIEIHKFGNPQVNSKCRTRILATSYDLVLIEFTNIETKFIQFLVYNLITKEHIKLSHLSNTSYVIYNLKITIFDHALQSSSYKIFLACYKRLYIYRSSSHTWQHVNFFFNFELYLQYVHDPISCIM